MKRYLSKSLESIPHPRDCENHDDYIVRVTSDKHIKACYTPTRARIMAEREWSLARARSIVCVTTSEGQFLLFNNPKK